MPLPDTKVDSLEWRSPSGCAESHCIQVAEVADGVAVRDSKATAGSVLVFSREEWSAFVNSVKRGHYDNIGRTGR